MERNYFMVRIGQNPWEYAKKGLVAIGWSSVDLSHLSPNEAAKVISAQDYNAGVSPQLVGRKKNEVWRFKSIAKGDIIVVPYGSNILLAESLGEYFYCQKDAKIDMANQLKVRYQQTGGELRILPRTELSTGLSARLRTPGTTIADLNKFADEIRQIFDNADYSIAKTTADKNIELERSFKERLIFDIRNGKTRLEAGGEGLENLVKILFEIEGYSAKILSKQAFSGVGDADVEAVKIDTFTETKILAQIKHHNWNTGDWGLQQLERIKENGKYADYKPVLITSGSVSENLRNLAANKDIYIMDGNGLADWIFVHLAHLPDSVRARLNISSVPMFL